MKVLLRRLFRVRPGTGGRLPRYTPAPDSRPLLLSPGHRIVDPGKAEALGLTADAERLRR
ncbi:hypothetical protein HHL19_16550 [Streptomyces sp. R302]|uniref:hypothetical protein n=1 Tax=unclassified Streptomyces TaxID=2593676 RepID=UPI00145CEA8D|nr:MULTISPECIES: hypothetical protein [unclassified Streptomyces]NML55380.1 hypothetical protein [Streptomyces sp. R301]NML80252.1 hypothetical protein [Streptomyces sp. R302]